MKLREIIERIDRCEDNKNCGVSSVAEHLNIYDLRYEWGETRLNSYYFIDWQCTDTQVGWQIYFLDDEAVALSQQQARKSQESFHWMSMDAFRKTRDYLLTLQVLEPEEEFEPINLDVEFDEVYHLKYSGEVYRDHKMTLGGDPVELVTSRVPGENYPSEKVEVKLPDGTTKIVNVSMLDIHIKIV